MIDITLLKDSIPFLIRGSIITLEIGALSCSIGVIIGIIGGLFLQSSSFIFRALMHIYTTIFRGTPMLIQIIVAVLVVPQLGIPVSRFWGVVIAIGLNSGAYMAHIIKAGISSVSKGQKEAAKTLGLNNYQIIRFIILPQAIRIALPALGNEFITLVKDSSLASIVGVQELTKEAQIIESRTFDALTTYLGVALCYLIITSFLSLLISFIERKINHHVIN